MFVVVAVKYQRRMRDELTQHNQQQVVEDVYERYLAQETKVKKINEQLRGSLVVITAVP